MDIRAASVRAVGDARFYGLRALQIRIVSIDEGCHDEPALGLFALAVGLDVVASLQMLVDDLALERSHRLEPHRPAVVDGGLGGLVGRGAQRDRSALAVAGGVNHHSLAVVGATARDPVGNVLDRVDHLAVAADQKPEVVPLEVGVHLLLVLADEDLGVDADRIHDALEQLLYA